MSEKAKHTPGPWWIDDDGCIASGHGDDYVTVADPWCMPTKDAALEVEANARLIAAAPETLSTLGKLAASYDRDDAALLMEAIGEAQALLVKINGEDSEQV